MSTLDEIAIACGTDKSSLSHGYCERYCQFFEPIRQNVKKVLEIGIASGASLKMWRDYFPNAVIHGVDHNQAFVDAMTAQKEPRIESIFGDASEVGFWVGFEHYWHTDFDLVIDDASHSVWATYQAFKFGWRLLKPLGYWVIEDVHAGFDAAYRRDNAANGLPVTWSVPTLIADLSLGRLHEFGSNQSGQSDGTGDIESVTYFKSLIVIQKRL